MATKKTEFTLKELAALTESELVGNPDHLIMGVESLELAGSNDASFLGNPQYESAMRRSSAGVIFIGKGVSTPPKGNYLITENPSLAFQKTAEALLGTGLPCTGFKGVHPTAVVHPSATIGNDVVIGPYVVLDEGVLVGNGSTINAHCYVGPFSTIGDNCLLHARVTIREGCTIGNHVILQPGAVIGSCGFGYTTNRQGRHSKLNQLGGVTLGDDVEVGANTTIDRGRFKNTDIQRGTKIDNLVQIGHGVSIGEDNIIVALTGIAGSSKTGRRVVLAGQVAIAGHLKICDDVAIGGRSAVAKSITKAGKYAGHPLLPLQQHQRNTVHLRNITEHVEKIKDLQAKLDRVIS